jgi:hypothetical protein
MCAADGIKGSLEVQATTGATVKDGNYAHWLAKEAVRHGELRLGTQISSMNGMMSRATSILGWSVTISLALGGWLASNSLSAPVSGKSPEPANLQVLIGALAVALSTFASAICCIPVLWPGQWRGPGHEPRLLFAAECETESEMLEAMAKGYRDASAINVVALGRIIRWLRAAWFFFAASPAIGLIAYLAANPNLLKLH